VDTFRFVTVIQVSKLEQELLTGNARWLSDQQGLEGKLTAALEDLERQTLTVRKLTDTVR